MIFLVKSTHRNVHNGYEMADKNKKDGKRKGKAAEKKFMDYFHMPSKKRVLKPLKKLIEKLTANRGFDSEEVAEYKEVFDYFDQKHTGYITSKQMATTLRALKPNPDEFIVLQKVDEIDHDCKGRLNFQQYLDVLHNVIRKSKQKKRKRSCYTNLSEKQMGEIRDAFTMFDHDGDGSISAGELKSVMMNIGVYSTDEDVNDMVKELDADDSGSLDFPEFVSLMTRKISGAEVTNEMLEAFRYFDKDGDGTISAAEVRQVMDALGEDLSDSEIDEMIKEADHKGKGGVSYDDFVKMISSQ